MNQVHRVECEVQVDPQEAMGIFANAFRVVEDEAGRCLLEFFVYSSTEDRAVLVSRIPVRKNLLPVFLGHLNESL